MTDGETPDTPTQGTTTGPANPDTAAANTHADGNAADDAKGPTDKPRPRRRWLRRARGFAISLVVLAALHALVGYLGVPWIVQGVVVPWINDRIAGRLSIDTFATDPYRLSLRVEGLRLVDARNEPMLDVGRVEGDLQLIDTLTMPGIRLAQARVFEPDVQLVINSAGRLNLLETLDPLIALFKDPDSPPLTRLPHIVIDDCGVVDAHVALIDRTPEVPFELRVSALDIEASPFSTGPNGTEASDLTIALGEGETVTWQGTLSTEPLGSTGRVTVENLDLARFMPYAMALTRAHLNGGTLSLTADYAFTPAAEPRVAEVRLETLSLAGLATELDGEPWLTLDRLGVRDVPLDLTKRRVSVGEVTLSGLSARGMREPDGSVREVELIKELVRRLRRKPSANTTPTATPESDVTSDASTPPPQSAASPDDTAVEAPAGPIPDAVAAVRALLRELIGPWHVQVDKLAGDATAVTWADRALAQPLDVRAGLSTWSVGPLTMDLLGPEATVALNAETVTAQGAEASASFGTSDDAGDSVSDSAGAMHAGAEATLERIDLATLGLRAGRGRSEANSSDTPDPDAIDSSEAGQRTLTVSAMSGTLSGLGVEGSFTPAGEAAKARSIDGSATVQSVELVALNTAPAERSITLERLTLASPDASVTLPLLNPPKARPTTRSTSASVVANPESSDAGSSWMETMKLRLDALSVQSGRVTVTDRGSLAAAEADASALPLRVVVDQAAVSLNALDTGAGTAANVAVEARVQEQGRVRVSGTVASRLRWPDVDLQVAVGGVPMRPFDAALRNYLGHASDSGRLSLDWPLTVTDRQLSGTMDLRLQDFYLGKAVGSALAPSVPMKLGLAVVRDPSGLIAVRVPVSGDLSKPGFGLHTLILENIVPVFVQAATTPFKFVTGALGVAVSDEDLRAIEFPAGSAELAAEEREDLVALRGFLSKHPSLNLVLEPVVAAAPPDTAASSDTAESTPATTTTTSSDDSTPDVITPEVITPEVITPNAIALNDNAPPAPPPAPMDPDAEAAVEVNLKPKGEPAEEVAPNSKPFAQTTPAGAGAGPGDENVVGLPATMSEAWRSLLTARLGAIRAVLTSGEDAMPVDRLIVEPTVVPAPANAAAERELMEMPINLTLR